VVQVIVADVGVIALTAKDEMTVDPAAVEKVKLAEIVSMPWALVDSAARL